MADEQVVDWDVEAGDGRRFARTYGRGAGRGRRTGGLSPWQEQAQQQGWQGWQGAATWAQQRWQTKGKGQVTGPGSGHGKGQGGGGKHWRPVAREEGGQSPAPQPPPEERAAAGDTGGGIARRDVANPQEDPSAVPPAEQGAASPAEQGGAPPEKGGGDGKQGGGKQGGGKAGGKSPGKSGEAYLAAKGRELRRTYQQRQNAPPATMQQQRRQEIAQWHRENATEHGPQYEDHRLNVSWPHGFSDLGHEFMHQWKDEARLSGISLRLATHRNSVFRFHKAEAAATYALSFSMDPNNYDKDLMMQFFMDFAKAASAQAVAARAARQVQLNDLDWEYIVRWWDGEDRLRLSVVIAAAPPVVCPCGLLVLVVHSQRLPSGFVPVPRKIPAALCSLRQATIGQRCGLPSIPKDTPQKCGVSHWCHSRSTHRGSSPPERTFPPDPCSAPGKRSGPRCQRDRAQSP